jgi:hypothetical protein
VRGHGRDEGRDACGEPWMLAFGLAGANSVPAPTEGDDRERPELHDPLREHVLVGRDAEEHHAARRPEPEATFDEAPPVAPAPIASPPIASPPAEPADDTRTLVDALYRVADAFERVADSIDADRAARRSTLDDVDALLRTLVGELRSPAAVAPVVLAGTIDATDSRSLTPGDDAIDLAADERRPFERPRRH